MITEANEVEISDYNLIVVDVPVVPLETWNRQSFSTFLVITLVLHRTPTTRTPASECSLPTGEERRLTVGERLRKVKSDLFLFEIMRLLFKQDNETLKGFHRYGKIRIGLAIDTTGVSRFRL